MPSIFVCYRREDAAGHAGRLYDFLVTEFGSENVTMDIDAFEPGVEFVDELRKAVSASDIMLVLIGRRWADAARRLEDPNDFVRLQIRTALNGKIPTIPVLVGGAHFPSLEQFPEDIHDLTLWNGIQLSDDRWAADVTRLIEAINGVVSRRSSVPTKPKPIPREAPASPKASDTRDIFISYVEEDSSTASALAKALRAQQQSTWTYEEDGVPGVSYLTQVFEAIDTCRAVVLVASATSVHARQVIKEVEAAHEREKMIIPVRIGLTHQELAASNPILRMAIGTAVTLAMDPSNLAGTATRIANALRLAR